MCCVGGVGWWLGWLVVGLGVAQCVLSPFFSLEFNKIFMFFKDVLGESCKASKDGEKLHQPSLNV